MNTFGLDKNYRQIDFEEVTVEDLEFISGGSGGGGAIDVNLINNPQSTFGHMINDGYAALYNAFTNVYQAVDNMFG